MRALAAICIVTVCSQAAWAQIAPAERNQVKAATLRVEAEQCGSGNRAATGFVWDSRDHIVTSLHAVAGCLSLRVVSPATRKSLDAKIVRVLKRADLALLQTSSPIEGVTPLHTRTSVPSVSETLSAVGYPVALEQLDETEVVARGAEVKLRSAAGERIKQELTARRFPSLDLAVVVFDDALPAGMSGAPVVDRSGLVVAIAQGGLDGEVAGRWWGVSTRYLPELKRSQEPTIVAVTPPRLAAESEVRLPDTLACGARSFRKTRTVTFADARRTSDDPGSLAQLESYQLKLGVDPATFRFDVYESGDGGGATFFLPEGTEVLAEGEEGRTTCIASVHPSITIVVRAYETGNMRIPEDMQPVALGYERSLTPVPPWEPDSAWTYTQVASRADGLMVRRKLVVRSVAGNSPTAMATFDETAFETLAGKGTTFLGVTGVNRSLGAEVTQRIVVCGANPGLADCGEVKEYAAHWFATVISAFLTTFGQ